MRRSWKKIVVCGFGGGAGRERKAGGDAITGGGFGEGGCTEGGGREDTSYLEGLGAAGPGGSGFENIGHSRDLQGQIKATAM